MQVGAKSFVEEVLEIFGFGSEESAANGNTLTSNKFLSSNDSEATAVERNLVDRSPILRAGLNNAFAAAEASRFDYQRIQGVRGNRFVTAEFLSEVENTAQRIGTRPEYLLAVMSFETGGTFDPAKRNGIGATGLIQFLVPTAEGLGTSTAALARMSSVEQLRYVEKYFDQPNFRGRLGSLEGLYTAVLSGRARQNSDDVLFRQGTSAYRQNPLDWNNDGQITAGEAITPVAARMFGGVRAVQQRLLDAGFVPENQQRRFADGDWGADTSAALRRFQEANGLPATGLLDDRTGRRLFGLRAVPATNPTNPSTPGASDLQRGSEGAAVVRIQDNLIKLGFLTEAQKSTGAGVFGPQTEAALKAFQRRAHLEANGRFDAPTERGMGEIELGLGRTTSVKNQNLTKGIQDRLVELGYLTRAAVDTGYGAFGPQTESAIIQFQARSGLPQTGRAADVTFRILFSESARRSNSGVTGAAYSVAAGGRHYTVEPGILMTDSLRPQLQNLADRYHEQTGNNLHITSGYRPPARQASAMYDLIHSRGERYVRDLYTNKTAVDQILAAYRNSGGSRAEAIAAMTRTINNQIGHGTYISDHLRSEALDISTSANFRVLSRLVRELGGSVLNEGNHFHVEL
ncbi:MAG TPA: peptidoglycan-binding protein [Pyrinomonadaceae bacterium]|jgi:peptidoglycan hydrolase-like protein with peptidoglycan-binding domain